MASLHAPPVTRDNIFFYSGNNPSSSFYVKVESRGHFHQHPRADSSHLYALLTYKAPKHIVFTNKGTFAKLRPPPPHKDETEHFYCAQLIHYGLKPLKTKVPAKKALLAAFGNGRTLAVPARILELQEQLKADYEAANVLARQKYDDQRKAEKKAQEQRRVEARKKFDQVIAGTSAEPTKPRLASSTSGQTKEKTSKTTSGRNKTSDGAKLQYIDTAGHFDVQAAALSDEWPDMCTVDFTLRMSPSRETGRHLWAYFDFGIISGVMRCSKPPSLIGEPCTFTWRGTESSEGQMLYDKAQRGTITFLGNGRFKGFIEGGFFGKAQFVGTRDTEASTNRVWCMYVKQWKATYRSINASAYGVAEASRWGGWVEDTSRPDRPEDSDTSGGAGKSSRSDYYSDGEDSQGGDSDALGGELETFQSHKWPKQTARKTSSYLQAQPQDSDDERPPPKRRTKQTARRGGYSGPRITEPTTSTQREKAKVVELKPADMSGTFDIEAPELDYNYSSRGEYSLNEPNSLKLLSSTSRLWASFNFGCVFGVMRCASIPHVVGDTCTFTWRGTETGEGTLTFDEDNVGTITFLGDGKIEGVIEGSFFGRSTFNGAKKDELKELKSRYRSINYPAYAAAATARWGRSMDERSYDEGPAESDTSDGDGTTLEERIAIYDPDVSL